MNITESTTDNISSHYNNFARKRIEALLSAAGITIDGSNPWDPQISNPAFFWRVLARGSLGLGESYMDGWWDCDQLDEFINRVLRSNQTIQNKFFIHFVSRVQARLFNLQNQARAMQVGEKHYDVGNELYQAMLDRRMVYTCAYWEHSNNLDDAQRDKLDLVCRKAYLKPGMKVLDIGCGWGSLAKYAAQNYGVEVTGITVSKEQVALGGKFCEGLPVEIRLQDYREVNDKYDAIISLGMFEHVGHKNHRNYMEVAKRCLVDGGKFLLHTIGKNDSHPGVDPWISRYVFPNGEIPSMKQISQALESLMIIEDVHNFGPYYDRTLMAWSQNFNRYWSIEKHSLDRRFFRMWNYYLKSSAGAFRARDLQLWQIVITNGASVEAYIRPK